MNSKSIELGYSDTQTRKLLVSYLASLLREHMRESRNNPAGPWENLEQTLEFLLDKITWDLENKGMQVHFNLS